MDEPSTLERARSITRHAKFLGAPLRQFCVSVTKAEAFELIEWFQSTADPTFIDVAELNKAADEARKSDDPFQVLQHFTLHGLVIVARSDFH